MGNTFDYAEMAYLMVPRPFMVERGLNDRVARDQWVAYQYAKVRWLYAQLGLSGQTEIVQRRPHDQWKRYLRVSAQVFKLALKAGLKRAFDCDRLSHDVSRMLDSYTVRRQGGLRGHSFPRVHRATG